MFIVKKGFSGKVSGNKNQVLDIKDKELVKDLLRAGYIEEYSEKNQSNSELKKENENLKKTIQNQETEIETLKEELAKATSSEEEPETPTPEETGEDEKKTNE